MTLRPSAALAGAAASAERPGIGGSCDAEITGFSLGRGAITLAANRHVIESATKR